MRMLAVIATGAISAASVPAMGALLDDIVPPPWERFQPFTTFQEWDFNDPGPIAPDGDAVGNFFNEGKPNDLPTMTPGAGAIWDDGEYGGTGGDGSFLEFFIPNWIDLEPLKLIWIQINGVWQPGAAPPSVQGVFGQKGTLPPYFGTPEGSEETFPGFHRTELWSLQPNPDFEFIRIFIPEGAFVTQVVIDTISFPTPGAVSAFGLAALGVARRRR